jgi:hypothetical protein
VEEKATNQDMTLYQESHSNQQPYPTSWESQHASYNSNWVAQMVETKGLH